MKTTKDIYLEVEEAIDAIRSGKMIIVTDSEGR